MAYGHAERTLAAIRLLEAETATLLAGLPHLDAEQSAWLQEAAAGERAVLEAGMRQGTSVSASADRAPPGGCHA